MAEYRQGDVIRFEDDEGESRRGTVVDILWDGDTDRDEDGDGGSSSVYLVATPFGDLEVEDDFIFGLVPNMVGAVDPVQVAPNVDFVPTPAIQPIPMEDDALRVRRLGEVGINEARLGEVVTVDVNAIPNPIPAGHTTEEIIRTFAERERERFAEQLLEGQRHWNNWLTEDEVQVERPAHRRVNAGTRPGLFEQMQGRPPQRLNADGTPIPQPTATINTGTAGQMNLENPRMFFLDTTGNPTAEQNIQFQPNPAFDGPQAVPEPPQAVEQQATPQNTPPHLPVDWVTPDTVLADGNVSLNDYRPDNRRTRFVRFWLDAGIGEEHRIMVWPVRDNTGEWHFVDTQGNFWLNRFTNERIMRYTCLRDEVGTLWLSERAFHRNEQLLQPRGSFKPSMKKKKKLHRTRPIPEIKSEEHYAGKEYIA